MSYNPKELPPDAPQWAKEEFKRLQRAINDGQETFRFRALYAAPDRTYPAMVVYADGVTWNPGSGEGVYRRNLANSAWVFLG